MLSRISPLYDLINSADDFGFAKEYITLFKEKENNGLYIEVDLPGVKKEDITLTVEDRKLKLNAERKGNRACKYERTISFPKHVDVSSCDAKLEDGVLRLDFKENEETKQYKQIAIR